MPSTYIGRFAPSPTGPLHLGSLAAALGSCLEARRHGGQWLLRMEDLDPPREIPGVAAGILRSLTRLGFRWDGPVVYQSSRHAAYAAAATRLEHAGQAFLCACSRSEIADSSARGLEGPIYPGTCRARLAPGKTGRALRLRVAAGDLRFEDQLQGTIHQDLARDIGDFVIRRADGCYAYQLAVVVDDAVAGITHVVRGADLLLSTPRQLYLQTLLGLPSPIYMHLPVALDEAGEKLSKQTHALPVDALDPAEAVYRGLAFLRQAPPEGLRSASIDEIWAWAENHWRTEPLKGLQGAKID